MNNDCQYFESITKRWAYCSDKDEYELKDEEALCKGCPHKPKEEECEE